jgi:hypothetical protein
MSGLFGDIDIASANANPFFKPDGTYLCDIALVEVRTAKSGSKGFALEYIILEGPKKDKKIQEWKTIPMPWQLEGYDNEAKTTPSNSDEREKIKEDAERNMSFLKRRLKDFGIPVEEMNSVDQEYLLNKVRTLEVTIKNSGDNERITGVKVAEDYDGATEKDPFAS